MKSDLEGLPQVARWKEYPPLSPRYDEALTGGKPKTFSASESEGSIDLSLLFTVWRLLDGCSELRDGSVSAGIVNLLCSALRHWAKWITAADLVPVAVGSDDACTPPPTSHLVLVLTLWEERLHPIGCFIDSVVNECIGALLDQLASLIECLPHFWTHGSVGVWDKSCDQAWLFSRPS